MARQRSQSTSSMNTLAKSPTSLTASLSTSVALYDNQQPPKALQDILLLAQSHYISHRYVPALTLYKLAAERHHSLPACCSLYALYTSTMNVTGLVRSDTKATQILLYALRIWTARRWSSTRLRENGSMRSKTRDDHDELEEYFAHPRRTRSVKMTQRETTSLKMSMMVSRPKNGSTLTVGAGMSTSMESEYRSPMHLDDRNRNEATVEHEVESQDGDSEGECDDECEDCDDCEDESDEEDEEQEKEEEARRIGLATAEIEDIVQKLCLMIQKGVLGLDEPVLIEAVSTLRTIERGLSKEAEAWRQELARSRSLFTPTIFSEGAANDETNTTRPDLLLTQGIDLSLLDSSPDDNSHMPMIRAQPVGRHQQQKHYSRSIPVVQRIDSPVNAAIASLSSGEREQDQAMCRALRIRIMYTLGWVHQKKGEYHYGAQAYGVCSDIVAAGNKRPLNMLQQQAKVLKQTCLDLENKALNQAKMQPTQLQQEHLSIGCRGQHPLSPPLSISSLTVVSARNSNASCSSSIYTAASGISSSSSSSAGATGPHPDISIPSSLSGSESSTTPMRASGTISSLSAAAWSSGLFKLDSNSSKSTSTSPSAKLCTLQRSKSQSQVAGLKQLDTSSGLNKRAVQCGHCGQTRVLMPLCVCKKVRYCNGECRIADLERHRTTGCHAARIGIGALGLTAASAPAPIADTLAVSSDIAV
ncbi:hypothetical protein EDD11_007280 [Mortierella claussenii]|nr:hypothetical protein EDD11_007280 [Mortierella claussenii]